MMCFVYSHWAGSVMAGWGVIIPQGVITPCGILDLLKNSEIEVPYTRSSFFRCKPDQIFGFIENRDTGVGEFYCATVHGENRKAKQIFGEDWVGERVQWEVDVSCTRWDTKRSSAS